jgi:hypothetical protein
MTSLLRSVRLKVGMSTTFASSLSSDVNAISFSNTFVPMLIKCIAFCLCTTRPLHSRLARMIDDYDSLRLPQGVCAVGRSKICHLSLLPRFASLRGGHENDFCRIPLSHRAL